MGEPAERSIIVVSGAPASGKSTVARALSEMLDFPLFSKDIFKESLFETLGNQLAGTVGSPVELSRLLSRAAMDVLWSVAPCCRQIILEANFRPKDEHERECFAALPGRKLEIYCHCSPEEATRRFRERATTARDHPAHSMKTISAELLEEFDRPFGLCPVIDVDTECPVDALEIVERIRKHWADVSDKRHG